MLRIVLSLCLLRRAARQPDCPSILATPRRSNRLYEREAPSDRRVLRSELSSARARRQSARDRETPSLATGWEPRLGRRAMDQFLDQGGLIDLTSRKPVSSLRRLGTLEFRAAAPILPTGFAQLPPRKTTLSPAFGPRGSTMDDE